MKKLLIKIRAVARCFIADCLCKDRDCSGEKRIFFRDDDVSAMTPQLERLLDVFISHGVPIDLAVIPGLINQETVGFLLALKRKYPGFLHFHQHGFKHKNHSLHSKRFEFGESRTFAEQYGDIKNGQELMKEYFSDPGNIFTPPFHGYDAKTIAVLKKLNFKGISIQGAVEDNIDSLKKFPVEVDLIDWIRTPALKYPKLIEDELRQALKKERTVGVVMHHDFFKNEDFIYLASWIDRLKKIKNFKFINMGSIYEN